MPSATRKPHAIRLLMATLVVASAGAFRPSTIIPARPKQHDCSARTTSGAARLLSPRRTSALMVSSNCLLSEIFLLSFDGTVAQTIEYRIDAGIDLAFAAWPHLKELVVIANAEAYQNISNGASNHSSGSGSWKHEWLRNKMRSLSHVLVARPGVSLTCDYALLARLLMEEQELDGSRSNGSQGKYGSKFHEF